MIRNITIFSFSLLLFFALAWAKPSGRGVTVRSNIGPVDATEVDVTLAAAGTSLHNCLTDVVVSSTDTYTFLILDGGTTNFTLQQAANSAYSLSRTVDTALCGSANTAMGLKIQQTGSAVYYINYEGFVKD